MRRFGQGRIVRTKRALRARAGKAVPV